MRVRLALLALSLPLVSACDRGLVSPDGTDPSLAPVRDLVIEDLRTGAELRLSWTNPSDEGFASVRVLRREGTAPTSASDPSAVASEVTGETFEDSHLTAGTTYVYALYAVYDDGRVAKPATGEGTPTDPPELAPLANFVAQPSVDGPVGLSWVLPDDARAIAGVRVVRGDGLPPAGPDDGTLIYEGDLTVFRDESVLHGRSYGYAAFTFDDDGNFSTPMTDVAVTRTGAITGLVASSVDDGGQPTGRVTLSWTNPSDPGYAGTRVLSRGVTLCDGAGITSCVDERPEVNATVGYIVAAYDANGNEGTPALVDVFVQDPVALASAVLIGDIRGERALALDVAADGDLVLAGLFELDAAFGEGAPTLTAQGATDGFVAKLSSSGGHAWSLRLGGPGGTVDDANLQGWLGQNERVTDIAPLANGAVLVAGGLESGATLDGLDGFVFSADSGYITDPFVARYEANGAPSFAKHLGGAAHDVPVALDALDDGSFALAGAISSVYGTLVFGAGEPGETMLSVGGGQDAYVARYDATGALLFVKQVATFGDHDEATDVALYSDGSLVVTGAAAEAAVFGEGEPSEATLIGGQNWNFFVAKYAADGSFQWARGGVARYSSGIRVEALSDGSVLVTGAYSEDFTLDGGAAPDVTLTPNQSFDSGSFVARYSADGDLVFAVDDPRAVHLDVGVDGSFVTASREGIVRWSAAGDVQWTKPILSPDYPALVGVRLFADDSVVIAGDVSGEATFGSGDMLETTLSSLGSSPDIFLVRFTDGR